MRLSVTSESLSEWLGYWLIEPGLTGSIGAIHANRLSTLLHTSLSSKHHSHHPNYTPPRGLTGPQGMITLFVLSYPVMGCFYVFVKWVGWIDVSLGIWGWIGYSIAVRLRSSLDLRNSIGTSNGMGG